MSEKVSVIIPVYRAEKTLIRCVKSLVEGDYKNIEIILIEDGSTDNSWQICLQLQDKYKCVKAYRNDTNLGVSITRNNGLSKITGDYLMFVDSDDWVEPDYVSSFMAACKQYNPSLIVCGYVNHDEAVNAKTDYIGWDEQGTISLKSLKAEMLNMYHKRLLSALWNKLFFVSVIKENKLMFDSSIQMGEDFRFIISYIKYISEGSVVQINRGLYHYNRCGETSLMSRFGHESIEETLKDLQALYGLLDIGEEERKNLLANDKERQLEIRAYIILHNIDMSWKEKKRLILNMDSQKGKMLYKQNKILYFKEKVLVMLRKFLKYVKKQR